MLPIVRSLYSLRSHVFWSRTESEMNITPSPSGYLQGNVFTYCFGEWVVGTESWSYWGRGEIQILFNNESSSLETQNPSFHEYSSSFE